jgi:predicted acylesterase/phospholipase RssA
MERASNSGRNHFTGDSSYIPGEGQNDLPAKSEGESSDRPPQREVDHKLLEGERAYIKMWLEKTGAGRTSEENLTGLALSGGGIRSATFSLGVLQALAHHDILKYIDYLSTVSGGGYTGAGLTWWLAGNTGSTDNLGLNANSFPYGTDDPRHPATSQTPILTHLKDNASYLVPGGGISYLSGLAIVIRAVLLNLLVWIPVAAALFVLLLIFGDVGGLSIPNPLAGLFTTPEALKNGFSQTSYNLFYLLNWLGLGAIALFILACVDFAFFTRLIPYLDDSNKGRQDRTAGPISDNYVYGRTTRWGSVVAIAAAAAAMLYLWRGTISRRVEVTSSLELFVVTFILTFAGLTSALLVAWIIRRVWRVENLGFVYGMRRFFERLYGKILLIGLLLLAIGSIPLFVTMIGGQAATNAYGAIGIILGVASGVWGHLRSVSEKLGRLGPSVILPIGSVLLFFGIALLSYQFAIYWVQADGWLKVTLTAIFLVAVLSGFLTDINEISPHQFYRDRLMEAFLPDIERVKSDEPGSAKRAERFLLAEAWNAQDPRGPYPIVNTNTVLVNSDNLKYRLRGGDSFTLTPLYCGSNATGWTSTKTFAGGTLTLATAMAISGAAANPNTGVGGRGLTRNRFVSAVMTLLNLRLGFWVRHPSPTRAVARRPNHFHPGLTFCIPGFGYKERRKFLELSDGGHFENLGIYELVRRGCRLIIVCDGGQDIRASYSDFVSAIRRIEQDFGAEIEFRQPGGPERMIARPVPNEYPKNAEYADHGFLWATIKYHRHAIRGGPAEGIIVYLKTAMIKEIGIKAKGYKGAEPNFPDQSTGDQFFDEEQFEAYREVGYRIADTMVRDTQLDIRRVIREIKVQQNEPGSLGASASVDRPTLK